ncbi:MAG: thioredoxin family protein [Pyrinomonadaceae bacterium]|nr:thioredoxin family protein [Pyrinomonadaceae bacterium]
MDRLEAVKKIEMHLERDEFEVTFDASQIDEQKIIETIDKTGFKATLVASRANVKTPDETSENEFILPQGFKILDDAFAKAQKENKPLLIDFYAEWCVPCQRMEKETFADAKVKEILQTVILLKVDTDKEPQLAEKFGVVGLPDFRLIKPDGKEFRRLRGFQTAENFTKDLEEIIQVTKK